MSTKTQTQLFCKHQVINWLTSFVTAQMTVKTINWIHWRIYFNYIDVIIKHQILHLHIKHLQNNGEFRLRKTLKELVKFFEETIFIEVEFVCLGISFGVVLNYADCAVDEELFIQIDKIRIKQLCNGVGHLLIKTFSFIGSICLATVRS